MPRAWQSLDQGLQLLLAAEARVEGVEVVGPVAVVAPVGEAGAGDEAVDVLDHRGDPQGGDAEVGDLVELLAQAGEVAAVEGALGLAVDPDVVAGIAVGEAVEDRRSRGSPRPTRCAAPRGRAQK